MNFPVANIDPRILASGHVPMDDSDDDSLERKPRKESNVVPHVDSEEKKKMGRPRIEGPDIVRDPVSDRIKKPRPPPSEKQLAILKEAREKRAAFVAERKKLLQEAKEKSKKVGVTRSALEETKKEAELAKQEAEKLKRELEETRKKNDSTSSAPPSLPPPTTEPKQEFTVKETLPAEKTETSEVSASKQEIPASKQAKHKKKSAPKPKVSKETKPKKQKKVETSSESEDYTSDSSIESYQPTKKQKHSSRPIFPAVYFY